MKIKNIPVIVTVVVVLVSIVATFTTVEVTQRAQGTDLKEIKAVQDDFRPRIRKLETNQAGLKERLESIQQEQRAATVRQASGRREILDAIKDLGNRIER